MTAWAPPFAQRFWQVRSSSSLPPFSPTPPICHAALHAGLHEGRKLLPRRFQGALLCRHLPYLLRLLSKRPLPPQDFNASRGGPVKPPFVVQFGYRGDPTVDNCWDDKMTSNETAPVVAPGNLRGYLSMSMGALLNKTAQTPYCAEGASYCALGFSTNVFINYANNSRSVGRPQPPLLQSAPDSDVLLC